MRLKDIKKIEGKIILLSGMAIGGNAANIEIGGNDNPILRNPLTKEPYIPGSSIKGKARSITEWITGNISYDGKVHSCPSKTCPVCTLFGRGAEDSKKAMVGPTRLIVRDSYLTQESREKLKMLKETTGNDTEIKYENTINRLTSAAMPRNLERVPAGTEFNFNMSYKVFDIGDNGKVDEENLNILLKAIKYMALDSIGGGGSRGNGYIELELYVDGEKIDLDSIK